MPARFAVGIDLGTTNTVVAWAPLEPGESPSPRATVFPIPQFVSAGEVGAHPFFPSALYAPLQHEYPSVDPFDDAPWVLGEYARRRGAEVPGRLVFSSKSWLVHAGVDRTAAILPWGAADDVPKISPVDAAAHLLVHLRRAWDASNPEAPLADQDVVLTVPASFDEVGRGLTVEAAQRAGIAPRLLEEPQAAFYDWMARAGHDGLARLLAATGGEALVLVVDVGGGTTDLSLVRVSGVNRVTRVAVGPHLLLGGDNMDLALAHVCEPRLVGAGHKLDPPRFAQLVAACRRAKEDLLGDSAPDEAPVTVLATGAELVGATRTTRTTREEVERIVLDGFFPMVSTGALPQRGRVGLVAMGLPYERDVAITRHVAAFLARHLPPLARPNAVLFNGGVFRAPQIADRVISMLSGRTTVAPHTALSTGHLVDRLADADPDLAVARGAVAYALARRGRGVRIGGGSARAYFVGIASETTAGGERAICVMPRGAEEGASHVALGKTFSLAVGRPVRFDLLASDEVDACAGDVVRVDENRFTRLPPLAATIEAQRGASAGDLHVSLEGELTPIGTLDLACVEVDGPHRFRLAFQLRPAAVPPVAAARPPPLPPRRHEPALDLVDRVFGKPRADAGAREAKDLLRELERTLGDRSQWSTETNRALFDALISTPRGRLRSADHERVFWLLAGWCVRPGFGDALDAGRVAALAQLFDERLAFPGEARGWQQFWIAWRRAAGGLTETVHTKIRNQVDPHLARGGKRPKKPALSLDDALDMASSLERVAPERRVELGGWVLERTWTDRDPRLWSAIGRLGARVPAYASAHHVVMPHAAERWLDHLLREKWEAVPTAARAAMQLARRTGDRARDVGEAVRSDVEARLVAIGADDEWVRAVREVVAVDESERAAFFGDTLPPGLRLV